MQSIIPFHHVSIPEGLVERIETMLKSGGFGGAAHKLELDVAAYAGKAHALAASSSTAALHLAMCALDLKRGDKVLCPVNAFADLPEVVRHFDAEPVFVDVLPESYAIDPEHLRKTVESINSKKVRAILVIHPGGHPAPMEEIREIADTFGLKIIEDATDLLGTSVSGTYSDLMVFGFGSKIDNILDGGVLLTDQTSYDVRARMLRNHGLVYPSADTPYLYDVLDIGCQYRMQDFSALYCQELFAHHEAFMHRRRAIADRYRQELKGLEPLRLPHDHPEHSMTQFIVQIATNRDAFARKLREKGVEVGVPFVPLNHARYYKEKYHLRVFDFATALEAYQKVMSIPIHPDMQDDEVEQVCRAVIDVAKDHR
jgi:dTDP-4-amino-4,6-dideoxygalactose transaminase